MDKAVLSSLEPHGLLARLDVVCPELTPAVNPTNICHSPL